MGADDAVGPRSRQPRSWTRPLVRDSRRSAPAGSEGMTNSAIREHFGSRQDVANTGRWTRFQRVRPRIGVRSLSARAGGKSGAHPGKPHARSWRCSAVPSQAANGVGSGQLRASRCWSEPDLRAVHQSAPGPSARKRQAPRRTPPSTATTSPYKPLRSGVVFPLPKIWLHTVPKAAATTAFWASVRFSVPFTISLSTPGN